jgi:hypothetical protein
MHSKDQQVIKLISSDDLENKKLGQNILKTIIQEDNVIYWYIKLHTLKLDNTVIFDKITKLVQFDATKSPAFNIPAIYTYLILNQCTLESAAEFMIYNENIMLHKIYQNNTRHTNVIKAYERIRYERHAEKFNKDL